MHGKREKKFKIPLIRDIEESDIKAIKDDFDNILRTVDTLDFDHDKYMINE